MVVPNDKNLLTGQDYTTLDKELAAVNTGVFALVIVGKAGGKGSSTANSINTVGEYLEGFKPSSTVSELLQQQVGKGGQTASGTKAGTEGHYL